ncbi:MAG: pyruvate dehydrogenase (acetyl-transferring) E1 component subunit alpha [Phycisphaerales bacterium]|nr:pyruvate dehydrogenase (acetyl-transferring) E1 component subunit alpha [Phycisphaerales bacterium]
MTRTAPASPINRAARIPTKTLRQWLRDMLLIREFEVRCMQAYQNKKIGGFCHVYIGQEAVAVGCTAAVRPDDPIITAYRCHGHALARGMKSKYCMAELFGRIGGCAKGKGGSMHMFDKTRHFYGGHGIVGAQCPLGTGLAFATKYIDEVIEGGQSGKVTLCFMGDGALNQGSFHEAMNLAGILDLPIIFICENNGYSMGTAISRGTTMGHEITSKAAGYGMESAVINGMDALSVFNGMKPLADRCRETSRPVFVDMRTYRFKGHSMSDPRKYRTKEEEQKHEADDPIDRLAAQLINDQGMSKEEYDELIKDVRNEVREAMEWADASPPPPLEELYTDVYVETWGPYKGTSPPMMFLEEQAEAEAQKSGAKRRP